MLLSETCELAFYGNYSLSSSEEMDSIQLLAESIQIQFDMVLHAECEDGKCTIMEIGSGRYPPLEISINDDQGLMIEMADIDGNRQAYMVPHIYDVIPTDSQSHHLSFLFSPTSNIATIDNVTYYKSTRAAVSGAYHPLPISSEYLEFLLGEEGSDIGGHLSNICISGLTLDINGTTAPPTSAPTSPTSANYILIEEEEDWFDALMYCEEEFDTSLATVLTAEQMAEAINLTHLVTFNRNEFWVGLNDLAKEGEWRWADGTPWCVHVPTDSSCNHACSDDSAETESGKCVDHELFGTINNLLGNNHCGRIDIVEYAFTDDTCGVRSTNQYTRPFMCNGWYVP